MLESWGRLLHRRRRPVLVLSALALVVAALWGTGVFGALTSAGGFDTPGSESDRATALAERHLGRNQVDVIALYTAPDGTTIDDPKVRAAVTGALAGLPRDKVAGVATFWSTGSPAFVSGDRTATYAAIRLAGADDQARSDHYADLRDRLERADGGVRVALGGQVATQTAVNDRVGSDIARAEMLSLPILLVLLVLIFRGLIAAALPLVVGGVAILGSFTALHLLTLVTDVSVFAINITTFLGLGLAIDYGLFIVSRFREELDGPGGTSGALARTMATAGRTVLVSGVTVAVSLAGLVLFPQMFLRSMGFGGVATVLVCMLGALTVLPALLAVLGPRVNALSLRRRPAPVTDRWARAARAVMRRPVAVLVGLTAVLLIMAAPLLRLTWGEVDARVLPDGTQARVVAERLETGFTTTTAPITVVLTGLRGPQEATAFARSAADLDGVTEANVVRSRGGAAEVAVGYDGDTYAPATRALVDDVRALPTPPGAHAAVGGSTAMLTDTLTGIGERLPWLALTIGLATFVLLFLAFGSVVLPLKAMTMTALSLAATFGVLVLIFQEGWGAGVLGFTATGALAPAMPILMLAMLFGLTMDYEVFLLSRVRERYDATGDNAASVASGIQHTGRIITGAAVLFIVVMGAFATSGITFIKMTGIGMVLAIALDATIVRLLLVPAAMRLMGRFNWWAPGPLARLYRRYGIKEEPAAPAQTGTESTFSTDRVSV
ncbi:MMPL family transporter [Actinomadura flavalba]|uniref:MMPL family transporter n=1 Tax=Actinomadura flavalba TaxID=1120938 RepID=UPI000370952B|nr:MMPL family transporter [Actinomadura flavalba]